MIFAAFELEVRTEIFRQKTGQEIKKPAQVWLNLSGLINSIWLDCQIGSDELFLTDLSQHESYVHVCYSNIAVWITDIP